jgi:hypothetical protein
MTRIADIFSALDALLVDAKNLVEETPEMLFPLR